MTTKGQYIDDVICSIACDLLPNGSTCLGCMNGPIIIDPDTSTKKKKKKKSSKR